MTTYKNILLSGIILIIIISIFILVKYTNPLGEYFSASTRKVSGGFSDGGTSQPTPTPTPTPTPKN
ncbi:hypothetical protein HZA38_01760 [Candidatus Peregrinibacteria bacterium]|nr:hypothetical protein [Candidatus Peregrinibacteria bacterium]